MNFRIIYHKNKNFFYKNFNDINKCKENYKNLDNNNKIIIDISNNILEKLGEEEIINKLLKYNLQNLFSYQELKKNKLSKKYHIALYFLGHFIPNCEELVELQLNNYINCTFDIYIITEKVRLYGRLKNKNNLKEIFNLKQEDYDNTLNNEKFIKCLVNIKII